MTKENFIKNMHNYRFVGLVASVIFTAIAMAVCINNSVFTSIQPKQYSICDDVYDKISDCKAIRCSTGTLYYTGYDYYVHKNVVAHYYYSLENGKCTIFLVNNHVAGETATATLDRLNFRANIRHGDTYLRQLLENMAADLDWNYYSLANYTNTFIVSQYHYNVPWLISMIALTVAGVVSTAYFFVAYQRFKKGKNKEAKSTNQTHEAHN